MGESGIQFIKLMVLPGDTDPFPLVYPNANAPSIPQPPASQWSDCYAQPTCERQGYANLDCCERCSDI